MDDNVLELDGLTASLIADNLVCPYVPDCHFYRICNHPDHNSLYYATHFCGDKYKHCQVYEVRTNELKPDSQLSMPESDTENR